MTWTPEKNRDYQREYQRRRRQDPVRREEHNEAVRKSYARNPEKQREYSRRYRETHLEQRLEYNHRYAQQNKDRRRLLRFGITPERYDEILQSQGGHCAICGIEAEGAGRTLAIDHDHQCCPGRTSCGKCVRGLLCNRHNLALGQFGDDLGQLEAAVRYMRAWGGQ
jgi:hypothetical protein